MAQHSATYTTVQLSHVTFSYGGAVNVLRDVTFGVGLGWTGVVGANGSGKSTLLALATRGLTPSEGTVVAPDDSLLCLQPTETAPERFSEFLYAFDETSVELTRRLGIDFEWQFRWETLSHGERKRAQIAVALWRAPEVLALDEPTNHIDAAAKELLASALRTYRGIGLLVSHDRELLDALCERCIFLADGAATVRPGGVSAGLAEAARDEVTAARELESAHRRAAAVETEAANRREIARGQQKRRSKAGLAMKDHDARFKRNLARYSGKDGTGGKLLRQLDGRVAAARAELDEKRRAAAAARRVDPAGVSLSGAESRADAVVRIGPGAVPLGKGTLAFGELVVARRDRIAVLGPNGSGKTTLIRRIAEQFPEPARELPFVRGDAVFLAQELTEADRRAVRTWAASLSNADRARVFSSVHRLGSDPERLLETQFPSPGEARKLIIACAELVECKLLVLDEPTNHLDLPSITLLEAAVSAFAGAVLFASHDARFTEAVLQNGVVWRITPAENGGVVTVE